MEAALEAGVLPLLILLVFPGIVSMQVYRLLMPARDLDWGNAVMEGFFYSTINLALTLPLTFPIHYFKVYTQHPFLYAFCALLVLLVFPILWPWLLSKAFRCKKFTEGLQIPFPTAWDYFFDKRTPLFVLVHLCDGKMVGGFFGGDSYATSYPCEGDLYLQSVYKVNDEGKFCDPIAGSRGLLIRKDQYTYIETFDVPTQEETAHE